MVFSRIRIAFSTIIIFIAVNANATISLRARTAPHSKAEYCQGQKDPQYFRSLAYNNENHLTLRNQGGLFNGGVCWWHSLFQRSALYLGVFKPELKKPDKALAKKIIHSIAAGEKVVEIPGYKNLSEFSSDWEPEIQSQLEAWQREDGFLKFAWVQGLSGSYQTDPAEIAKTWMYVLSRNISPGEIQWTMWQLKGIDSHASLDIGGKKVGNHFEIDHIDSNYPQEIRTITWDYPARSVDSYFGEFVPYVHRTSDFKHFKKAAQAYCSSQAPYSYDFFPEKLRNDLD